MYITKQHNVNEVFPTGSQRDSRDGKGRFDLVPITALRVWELARDQVRFYGKPIEALDEGLHSAMAWFLGEAHYTVLGQTLDGVAQFEWGITYPGRDYDPCPGLSALPWQLIERWAQLMARGADKYGERNWERGQPLARFYDSGMRHFYQWYCGTDPVEEDHFAAILYNFGGAIFTSREIEAGRLPAILDDRFNI